MDTVALAAAVTCASVALAETGVEMLDLPVACMVVGVPNSVEALAQDSVRLHSE